MDQNNLTKLAFMEAYAGFLIDTYVWAREEPEKLNRFLASVRSTIGFGDKDLNLNSWNPSGEAVDKAWRAIGGKDKVSLKKLRELSS